MRPHLTSRTRPGSVVITGGSSGIGLAAALTFARAGWRVGLIARGVPGLQAASRIVSAHGAPAVAIAAADVSDAALLARSADELEAALGPATVWVNAAGNGTYGRFLDTPADEYERVTAVTYNGAVNGTRVALARMVPRHEGRVVNICSAVAFHGMPLLASYSGAKHAVRGFGEAVQRELAQEGSPVTLVTVFPPAVNTPFFDHAPTHMGRPGRPMPPVYQPEVIGRAVMRAALGRDLRVRISLTTVAFEWGVMLAPWAIRMAIRRLGYQGQLAEDGDGAWARHEATLWSPSAREIAAMHGNFSARRYSVLESLAGTASRLLTTIRRK